jgi:tRNA 2-thiouridine synthesizing protein B
MLHIVNKSPESHRGLASCLRVAQDGDSVLLIEDAVYAATDAVAARCGIAQAAQRLKLFVLQPDLDARGVTARGVAAIEAVDYGGFVDLVAANSTSQSWL